MAARLVRRTLLYVVLVLFLIIFLLPVYMLIITSLKHNANVSLAHMWALPHPIGFSGLVQAWHHVHRGILNSLLLAIPVTIAASFVGAFNGYALSKWKFRGSNVVYFLILLGMFIPYQSTLIPLVKVLAHMGLAGTLPGLGVAHFVYGLPIMTLIFRNFFADIPNEIVESAQIDGNGYWGIFKNIMLPLSIPGFVVAGIWEFTQVWNDFLFGVTISQPPWQPVTVAIVNLAGSQHIQWNVLMASTLIASLPTLIVYFVLGRYFVRGLLAGSVKG